MDTNTPRTALEDARGVDVGQIRAQRRLPVAERIRTMVEASNVLLAVQATARTARSAATARRPQH